MEKIIIQIRECKRMWPPNLGSGSEQEGRGIHGFSRGEGKARRKTG